MAYHVIVRQRETPEIALRRHFPTAIWDGDAAAIPDISGDRHWFTIRWLDPVVMDLVHAPWCDE